MTRIPLPGNMIDSLLNGVRTGSAMYSGIMNPILQREKNKQQGEQFGITNNRLANQFGITDHRQAEQFAQKLALEKQAEARMGANIGLNRELLQQKILEHKLKTDPKMLFEFFQKIKQQGGQEQQMPNDQPMTPFSGGGMPSNEEIENPTLQMPQQKMNVPQQQSGGLFGNLSPDQQAMLQMAGYKIPTVKENPEQKRYADLQSKLALENYKTQQKKALEQTKNEYKNIQTHQKVVDSAKNDMPHLEQTLKSLEAMKKIATNNPDLFGHSGIFGFGSQGAGERFAKTTDNPNAGAWQTYGLGPIVAAESKMSAKGNQLALRQALANKPNFEEKQPVALSKINSSIKQIKQSIEENRKLTGDKSEKIRVWDNKDNRWVEITQEEFDKDGGQ